MSLRMWDSSSRLILFGIVQEHPASPETKAQQEMLVSRTKHLTLYHLFVNFESFFPLNNIQNTETACADEPTDVTALPKQFLGLIRDGVCHRIHLATPKAIRQINISMQREKVAVANCASKFYAIRPSSVRQISFSSW